jgi:hypothetical protein
VQNIRSESLLDFVGLQMCQLEVLGRNLDCHVLVSAQLQSVDSILSMVGVDSSAAC